MKKFQLNKQKLNLNKLTTPLLALSLMAGCAGLFGGSASAASVTAYETVNSSWQGYYTANPECDLLFPGADLCDGTGAFYPGISNVWPLSYNSLTPGGSFWHFGPEDSKYLNNPDLLSSEIPGDRRFEHLRFPSSLECENSRSVTSATYKMKMRINSNDDNNGVVWLALWDLNDGSNPVSNGVQLNANNISSNFVDYTFQVPVGSLPINLAELNKRYELVVMYESHGASSGKTLNIDIDEASREIVYDDTSANCIPAATPSTVTIPSTTPSGSTVVPGSSLAAADTDGDALTYSITAGNDEGYFAIDSNTGNITTTQTNIPAGTYTITVQVDDGKGGTATADVTITVTASTTPALYCPSPYSITTLLTPSGDCDEDGITNQTEGFDPDGDGNPNTGTAPIDTDGDSIPDYLDLDSDNDGILDTEEKGTLANSSTNPSDVDSDGTPDFRDLDSDNDSTKDVLESGRNNLDTNNDGRIDGTTNTYGIPSSAASTTNPKALASTSLKDSDNNGTPDYRQSSRNAVSVLAKTGESLKTITIVAVMALGLAGYVKVKNKNSREQSYKRI